MNKPGCDGTPLTTTLLPSEREAILMGLSDGDTVLARFASSGVLQLFVRYAKERLVDERLESLRAYAELSRVLRSYGRAVPTSALSAAGYSAAQIAATDAMIAAHSAVLDQP